MFNFKERAEKFVQKWPASTLAAAALIAVLGISTIELSKAEISIRTNSGHLITNAIDSKQSLNASQQEIWDEFNDSVRKVFFSGDNKNPIPIEEGAKIAKETTARVVKLLYDLENTFPGPDDIVKSMEIWPIVRNYVRSKGPLQIQSLTAAEVFLNYYENLKDLRCFKGVGYDEIEKLVENKDQEGLAQKLNLSSFGGVALGFFYYADCYLSSQDHITDFSHNDNIQKIARLWDERIPVMQQLLPPALSILNIEKLQDSERPPFNEVVLTQMALTKYNAGWWACVEASTQGMLNDILVADGQQPVLDVDGHIGSKGKKVIAELMERSGIDFCDIKNKLNVAEQEKRAAIIFDLWLGRSSNIPNASQRMLDSLEKIIWKDGSFKTANKIKNSSQDSFDALKLFLLPSGDANKMVASHCVAIATEILTVFNTQLNNSNFDHSEITQLKVQKNAFSRSWEQFALNRDLGFLEYLGPAKMRLIGIDDPAYQDIMSRLCERIAKAAIVYNFIGQPPMKFTKKIILSDLNPALRFLMPALMLDEKTN